MRSFIFLFLLAFASQPLLAQSSDNIYEWTGEPTDDGLTRVKYKGRTGYINDKKREVIEVQYADASDFEDGLAQVSKDGKLYGMINTSGKTVIPFKYDKFYYYFSEGMIPAELNGKWGVINKAGKTIIPHNYFYMGPVKEGIAMGSLEKGKFGYVDIKGKHVTPFMYDGASSFSEGLALVKQNAKYGYIDRKGKVIIPLQYEEGKSFSEGLAGVKINGKFGFINKEGKLVIPAIYDDAYSFSGGQSEVKLGTEAFRITNTGKRLSPGQYLMVYTKGVNMGKQYWNKSEKVPGDALHKKYQEGYRLTDYVYNQHTNEIFVTMSNHFNYMQNGISYNNTKDQLWKKTNEYFEDGYNTTHVTYGNGKWSWNATRLPRQHSETRIYNSEFPNKSVWDAYKAGRQITSLSYGDGKWMVIMRDVKYADQKIMQYDFERWDQEDVDKWMKKGYAITAVAKEKGTYYVVYTKGTGIKEQLLVWENDIPVREISSYWHKGYALYRTFYMPRWITIDKDLLDMF